MTGTTVVVLRGGAEGLGMAGYAEALRARLPDDDVVLARTPTAERELGSTARVITGTTLDGAVLDAADRLELFACTWAGTGHVPVDTLVERGVTVTNASGIHVPGIAEQAVGYLLRFARGHGTGQGREDRAEWRHYRAGELAGGTATVVGLGSIGGAVCERLASLDVHTVGVRYTPSKGGPADEVIGFSTEAFHEALARSEALVLAAPLTPRTRGLVGEAALATLPPSAVLVNVARGGLVDTGALVEALRRSAIRGAALDVTDPEPLPEDHPLWTLSNCLLTPHTGGHNPAHWTRLADLVAANVEALERGDELRNVVAGPGLDAPG